MTAEAPLAGIRIVDFTWVGAGPLATRLLADFGADVIKIESRARPDVLRKTPPLATRGKEGERSGYFAARNANKRSITLDMANAAGRNLAVRLIAKADVVANSFAPGVMGRWDLDYEKVALIKSDIVYLEMPMLGSEGPYRDFTGFGATLMAVSGMLGLCGYPDRDPVGTGTNYPDHVPNPMHAAFAVVAALIDRKQTGLGQKIEVSQLESTINVIGEAFMAPEKATRRGNRSERHSPHGVYPCLGDDRWIAVAVVDQVQWQGFCRAIELPNLVVDPRFASSRLRVENAQALDAVVSNWTSRHRCEDAMTILQANGVAAGVVNDARSLIEEDPNIAYLNVFATLDHAQMGTSLYLRPPILMERTPATLDKPAPILGEHTVEVCLEDIGMTQFELEQAEQAGAFG